LRAQSALAAPAHNIPSKLSSDFRIIVYPLHRPTWARALYIYESTGGRYEVRDSRTPRSRAPEVY
jgi:hypothetical protein